MRLPKLSSQGSKKTIPKELVDANNQIHEELKARSMLRTAEETKKRLLSEKSSLEAKIVELEKKKSSEVVTPQTQGAQLTPNAKTQARADPAKPFATCPWQSHAIKKTNKYISA
ncbi:hypothetical protein MTR67_012149 [Solanum verrucosum]|uniref:Uncharacterized protein n=1 Tax=Solanum verrucosum TaxID=315347 RepID=A0AAF0Q833_SOLVR|nr:hypothetical protein MTR67_012149 [Solanum verrucosum]